MIAIKNVDSIDEENVHRACPVPVNFPGPKSQGGHECREGIDHAVILSVKGLTSLVEGRAASMSRKVEWLVRVVKVEQRCSRLLRRCHRRLLLLLLLEKLTRPLIAWASATSWVC